MLQFSTPIWHDLRQRLLGIILMTTQEIKKKARYEDDKAIILWVVIF